MKGFQLSEKQIKELGLKKLSKFIQFKSSLLIIFYDFWFFLKKIIMYIPNCWTRAERYWIEFQVELNHDKIFGFIKEYEKSQKKQTKNKKK